MRFFKELFGHKAEHDALLSAIERAVNGVDPRLKFTPGYPEKYREPVNTALNYSQKLADSLPGPVLINAESYAKNPFVHALFPSADYIREAICASASLQDYYKGAPDASALYALMGMRRVEKNIAGPALLGDVVQRDVIQKAVYFTSHTIESPAATEDEARKQVALSFFDTLTDKVKKRAEARKRGKSALLHEKDLLVTRLRTADELARPRLQQELSELINRASPKDSGISDFEAILLNPEQHLRLNQTPIALDRMGITQKPDDRNEALVFDDLINFDRRNWTVTMVYCSDTRHDSFSSKLNEAYRRLVI